MRTNTQKIPNIQNQFLQEEINMISSFYELERIDVAKKWLPSQHQYKKHELFTDLAHALIQMDNLPTAYIVYLLRLMQQKFDIQMDIWQAPPRRKTQVFKLAHHFLCDFVLNPSFVIQPDSEKEAAVWVNETFNF